MRRSLNRKIWKKKEFGCVVWHKHQKKKNEKVYIFSRESVKEPILFCAERAKKIYGILCLPVVRWNGYQFDQNGGHGGRGGSCFGGCGRGGY